MPILCRVDDRMVPLYRVMWVAATPHFCGEDDCNCEGKYEIRLEQDESVWADSDEQAKMISQLEKWQGGLGSAEDGGGDEPW